MLIRFKVGTDRKVSYRNMNPRQGIHGFRVDRRIIEFTMLLFHQAAHDDRYFELISKSNAGAAKMEQDCPEIVDVDVRNGRGDGLDIVVRWSTAHSARDRQTVRSHNAGLDIAMDVYRKCVSIVTECRIERIPWARWTNVRTDGFVP